MLMLRWRPRACLVSTFSWPGWLTWHPHRQPDSHTQAPAGWTEVHHNNKQEYSPNFTWSSFLLSREKSSPLKVVNNSNNVEIANKALQVSEITRKASELVQLYTQWITLLAQAWEQNIKDNKEFQFTKQRTNNILSKTWYFMIYCFSAELRGSSII